MERKNTKIYWIKILILSLFCTLALCMRFSAQVYSNGQPNSNGFIRFYSEIKNSIYNTTFLTTLIWGLLLGLQVFMEKLQIRKIRFLKVTCFILAVIWLMGESFALDNSFSAIASSPSQIAKSLIYVIGITYLLTQAANLLFWALERKQDIHINAPGFLNWYRKRPFLNTFILLFLCMIPQVLISYPAIMCNDAWNQLGQYFGYLPYTSHHPPAFTWMIGTFEKIGQAVGSSNLGLFLFIFFQCILFSAAFAYLLFVMKQHKAPRWLRLVTFLIIVFLPYYASYVGLIVKDNVYSYAVVLFVIELAFLIELRENYWRSRTHVILWFVAVLSMMLFRNNGKYIIYPVSLILLVSIAVSFWKKKSLSVIKSILIILLPIVLANVISVAMVNFYGIEKGSIAEALSLPMQQTARYVKDHGAEVTPQEEAAIRKVLDYDNLAVNYDPRISDPVKRTFTENVKTEDLKNYLQVWFRQFLKHPLTYVEATANQNYYILYPKVENNRIYTSTLGEHRQRAVLVQTNLKISEVPAVQFLRELRTGISQLLFSLPITGLLSSLAFYNIIFIFLILYALNEKLYAFLFVAIPVLLSDLILILAPVIQYQPRYAFPVIYAMPFLLSYYLFLKRK